MAVGVAAPPKENPPAAGAGACVKRLILSPCRVYDCGLIAAIASTFVVTAAQRRYIDSELPWIMTIEGV